MILEIFEKSTRLQIVIIVLGAAIIGIVAIQSIFASTTITEDYGIGCGNRNWGIKNIVNSKHDEFWFGREYSCNIKDEYFGRSNVVVLKTESNANSTNAWQGIIQGCDGLGNCAPDIIYSKADAIHKNTKFPAAAKPSNNQEFKTKIQWVWNEESVNSHNTKIHFLQKLWFKNNKDTIIVVNLLIENLEGKDFLWKNKQVLDNDKHMENGIQYEMPHMDSYNHKNLYSYNAVIDNTDRKPGHWNEITANIDKYIDDAFNAKYYNSNNPGNRINFELTGQECGIEIQDENEFIVAEGAYSFCKLYYE